MTDNSELESLRARVRELEAVYGKYGDQANRLAEENISLRALLCLDASLQRGKAIKALEWLSARENVVHIHLLAEFGEEVLNMLWDYAWIDDISARDAPDAIYKVSSNGQRILRDYHVAQDYIRGKNNE